MEKTGYPTFWATLPYCVFEDNTYHIRKRPIDAKSPSAYIHYGRNWWATMYPRDWIWGWSSMPYVGGYASGLIPSSPNERAVAANPPLEQVCWCRRPSPLTVQPSVKNGQRMLPRSDPTCKQRCDRFRSGHINVGEMPSPTDESEDQRHQAISPQQNPRHSPPPLLLRSLVGFCSHQNDVVEVVCGISMYSRLARIHCSHSFAIRGRYLMTNLRRLQISCLVPTAVPHKS